jgi:hypothetical protein
VMLVPDGRRSHAAGDCTDQLISLVWMETPSSTAV